MKPRKSNWGKSEKARAALRRKNLAAPITPERIASFVKHLVAVSFGVESECWLYVGCSKDTTLIIPTNKYGNVKFNGENVGPHQFAFCAANGMTLSELKGYDVHHAAEFGRCIGYRCCNPEHLELVPTTIHRRRPVGNEELAHRQSKVVREVLGVPTSARRPLEHLTLTGTGARRRDLGGLPFLIQGGVVEEVLEDVSPETAEQIPA